MSTYKLTFIKEIKLKNNENKYNEEKVVMDENFCFEKVLSKKNELDDVDDMWYAVKSRRNRWVVGSAH